MNTSNCFCVTIASFLFTIILNITIVSLNASSFTGAMFRTQEYTRLQISKDTIEVYSKIVTECARQCVLLDQCCLASFSEDTTTCVLDQSGSCCIGTLIDVGWSTIKKQTANGKFQNTLHTFFYTTTSCVYFLNIYIVT